MALITKIKSAVGSILKRTKPDPIGTYPIGGQQRPGEASDFESWPPNADRDPAANVAAHKNNAVR